MSKRFPQTDVSPQHAVNGVFKVIRLQVCFDCHTSADDYSRCKTFSFLILLLNQFYSSILDWQ